MSAAAGPAPAWLRGVVRLAVTCAVALAGPAAFAAEARPVAGGDGTLYMAARQGRIVIAEEATFKVMGEIPLPRARPGPPYPLRLSQDHQRFYAFASNLEELEVVDIATRKVTDTISLSVGARRVRLDAYEQFAEAPGRLAFPVRAATKLVDRFEIGPHLLVEYDLGGHKVARPIPWPRGEERERVGLRYAPDGKLLYLFAEDVYIYDTRDLQLVDKWELSRPIEPGFGRLEFGVGDDVNEAPGFFTGLFTVDDPLQHRKLMGVARVDLAGKKVDFWPVGPAVAMHELVLSPGRTRAYGLLSEIGNDEFWTFDLERRRVLKRTPFPGRPRMSLAVSSNGRLLYVHGAGNDIAIYDAATHRYLRTVTFDFEVSQLFVFPPGR